MILRKFQFPSHQKAIELLGDPSSLPGINDPTLPFLKNQIVLGNIEVEPASFDEDGQVIEGPLLSPFWHVDIIFKNEVPDNLLPYLVWPVPNGYHNVPGLEASYSNAYNLNQSS